MLFALCYSGSKFICFSLSNKLCYWNAVALHMQYICVSYSVSAWVGVDTKFMKVDYLDLILYISSLSLFIFRLAILIARIILGDRTAMLRIAFLMKISFLELDGPLRFNPTRAYSNFVKFVLYYSFRIINKITEVSNFFFIVGTKFFVVCEPGTLHMENLLKHIYELYTDYVLKNPFYEMEMPIRCELFDINLAQAVQKDRVALLGRWPAQSDTIAKNLSYSLF